MKGTENLRRAPLPVKMDIWVLPGGLEGRRFFRLSSQNRAGEAFMLMYF
jgi:hypothetical protein